MWAWVPTWSEVTGVGGFDPAHANLGAYGGLVQGIVSRPKPPQAPGHHQPHQQKHPRNHKEASRKTLGAISLPWTHNGRYVCCVLALI